jgi:hypothetical protein
LSVEEFWKPFEVEIANFEGLLKIINQVMEKAVAKNIKFAWRGQIDARWSLHSSLYRRMNLTKGKILTEAETFSGSGLDSSHIVMHEREQGLDPQHAVIY